MKQNGLIKTLAVIQSILFLLLLSFISLRFITARNNLEKLALNYVKDNTSITPEVISTFEEIGLTQEDVNNIFSGKVANITAKVMGDQLSVDFHYADHYQYTQDEITDEIRACVESYENPDVITTYVMNMTGLTSMLTYKTPAAYRKKLSEQIDGNVDRILQGISVLISIPFICSIVGMNLILSLLIVFLMDTRDKYFISNIYIRPTIILLAFSMGEIICFKKQMFFTNYICKTAAVVSSIALALELIIFIPLFLCHRKET